MPFTSASTLRDALKAWSKDPTLTTATLDDCIRLAEVELNRDLPINAARDFETLTGSTSSRVLTPATNFVEPIALYITTWGDYEPLTLLPDGKMAYSDSGNGVPSAWAVVGTGSAKTIELDVPCDQAHTFEFYRRGAALNLASVDPNWLLTNHPDVYFEATKAQVHYYKEDFGKGDRCLARSKMLARSIAIQENKALGRARVTVDPALVRPGRFSITTGD